MAGLAFTLSGRERPSFPFPCSFSLSPSFGLNDLAESSKVSCHEPGWKFGLSHQQTRHEGGHAYDEGTGIISMFGGTWNRLAVERGTGLPLFLCKAAVPLFTESAALTALHVATLACANSLYLYLPRPSECTVLLFLVATLACANLRVCQLVRVPTVRVPASIAPCICTFRRLRSGTSYGFPSSDESLTTCFYINI